MTSRRRAVFHFLTSVALLVLSDRLRRSSTFDRRPEWSSRWVVVGAVWSALAAWLYDTGRWGPTSRRRRLVVSAAQYLLNRLFSRRWETETYEFSMGGSLGSALYRLRYGVLGPAPGTE